MDKDIYKAADKLVSVESIREATSLLEAGPDNSYANEIALEIAAEHLRIAARQFEAFAFKKVDSAPADYCRIKALEMRLAAKDF